MTLENLEGKPSRKKDLMIAFCVACNNLIIAMNHTAPTFFNYTPPFVCKGFENEDPCHVRLNVNKSNLYSYSDSDGTCPTYYQYYPANNEVNIVTEWDLVCDRKIYSALSVTWYFVAVAIGSMITGTLNDRYGRKTILYVCIYMQGIISMSISLTVYSYIMYVVFRFMQGLFMQGMMTSMTLIVNETLPNKYRAFGSGLICLFWTVGLVILSVLAYFIPYWRYLNLAICSISIILPTLFLNIIPESHIWLESRKAKKTSKEYYNTKKQLANGNDSCNQNDCCKDCTIFNGTKNDNQISTKDSQTNEENGDSVLSLLKLLLFTKKTRNGVLMMMLLWFTEAISYYGVTFSISEQAGNLYIHFFTGAILEEICYLAIVAALYRFRRKFLACFVYASASLCYTVVVLLASSQREWAVAARTFCLNLSKSCITSVYVVLLLYAVEIFPTKLRGMSLGICFIGHRIATFTSPVLLMLDSMWSQLPYLVLAVLNLISLGIAYFCLPEKRDKLPTTLTETIDEQKESQLYS